MKISKNTLSKIMLMINVLQTCFVITSQRSILDLAPYVPNLLITRLKQVADHGTKISNNVINEFQNCDRCFYNLPDNFKISERRHKEKPNLSIFNSGDREIDQTHWVNNEKDNQWMRDIPPMKTHNPLQTLDMRDDFIMQTTPNTNLHEIKSTRTHIQVIPKLRPSERENKHKNYLKNITNNNQSEKNNDITRHSIDNSLSKRNNDTMHNNEQNRKLEDSEVDIKTITPTTTSKPYHSETEITSDTIETTTEIDGTTDFELFERSGLPPALVASLVG